MRKKHNRFFDKGPAPSGFFVALALFATTALLVFINYSYRGVSTLSYSDVLSLIESKQIKQVHVSGQQLSGSLHNNKEFHANVLMSDNLLSKLHESGAAVAIDKSGGDSFFFYLSMLALLFLLGGGAFLLINFFRSMQGGGCSGGGRIFSVGRSKARFHPASSIKTKFDDVAGFKEVKAELQDVVEFLKSPEKFKKLGARIPRGVLLSGAPGNGKTLLAKAVAGEANCPFLSISGSDFVEMFVGVGASRVRDLFFQARRNSPAIIFIDELDTVGRQRGVNLNGGNDEREQTLNQLLSEMDGFSTEPGEVIVLGATNRVDILDKALLRPGRFDRVVQVPFPDVATREKILAIHGKNVKLDDDVDFGRIARGTPGCSGADLANLINEAALFAAKESRERVNVADMEAARDKLLLGTANKSIIRTEKELKETAYHESGHALMNLLLPDTDPFHKVTIVARGHALGVSMSIPEGDTHSHSYENLFARIKVALGGLIAEKLTFNSQTTGVSSDLQTATKIARAMVASYGMSKLAPVSFIADKNEYGQAEYSQATAEQIDAEIQRIIKQAYEEGEQLLKENMERLELLAKTLLKKETVAAAEVYELLGLEPRKIHSFTAESEAEQPEKGDTVEEQDPEPSVKA